MSVTLRTVPFFSALIAGGVCVETMGATYALPGWVVGYILRMLPDRWLERMERRP